MAPLDSNVRKLPEPAAPPYRNAPQNIEAEQALLGAILVNNEAYYRVSDFLESRHPQESCLVVNGHKRSTGRNPRRLGAKPCLRTARDSRGVRYS